MKVITLFNEYEDAPNKTMLFAVRDMNNVDEVEFTERIKEAIKPHVSSYFSPNDIETYANETLNNLKQGRYFKKFSNGVYLDIETIDVL